MGAIPNGSAGLASQGLVKFPEIYDYTNFGWVGVEIFFVISGFVIAFSGENATPFAFFRSRIVRLGPAVWICAPITLLATLLVGFSPDNEMYRGFRHSIAFLPWEPWIDSSYWTLGIEISFYAAVLILIKFSKFERIKQLAMVVGLISSLFWIVKAAIQVEALSIFMPTFQWMLKSRVSKLLLIHHGMFFGLGVFLWLDLIKKHEMKNSFWIILFSIGGCMQIVANAEVARTQMYSGCSAVIPCMLFMLSVALIIASVSFNKRLHALPSNIVNLIKVAGMLTYPLYLLHQVVGCAIMGWMVKHGADRWTALGTATFMIFFITWIVATQAEPWLQSLTKYLLNEVYDRYRLNQILIVKK